MPARAPAKQSAPAEVLSQLNGGYNGYTDPTLTNPKMWAAASNAFSGAFGYVQRARFANLPTLINNGPVSSSKFYAIPGTGAYLLFDTPSTPGGGIGVLSSIDTASPTVPATRVSPLYGSANAALLGPWSREVLENIVYEMNGLVKQTGRGANASTIESFGLDAPDASPQVTINAGSSQTITSINRSNGVVACALGAALTVPGGNGVGLINVTGVTDPSFNGTFLLQLGSGTTALQWSQFGQNVVSSGGSVNVSITKAIGRSYSGAWENVNKAHIGSPSPATQYIQYAAQNGVIDFIEPGTVATTAGSATLTGTGTFFTPAWIGRTVWIDGQGAFSASIGGPLIITSVPNATTLIVENGNVGFSATASGKKFAIIDPTATHLRLYATADGQAIYFRVQRNAINFSATTLATSGLEFNDTANSEPPNFPFTTETAQTNNVPPPVGSFINEYQGRLCIFGVSGAPQTFYYSNQESTSIGLQQESFAPLNQVTLPIANGKINGMLEFPGSMIIWSDKQDMFRLTGLLTDNTVTGVASGTAAAQQGAQIARLPYALGCASPFACEITPLGGIWLTSNAEVWLFTDRYAPRNIGRPVQDILDSIAEPNLSLARMKYYHNNTRNWLVLAVAANQATYNNTLLILDLDLLASNGSPSYFTFDMATNAPVWYVYQPGTMVNGAWLPRCDSVETVYETGGLVRLIVSTGNETASLGTVLQDVDYQGGSGTEISVPNGSVTFHSWGNDSAYVIKRPTWMRFNTNRAPSVLAAETAVQISSISRANGLVTVVTQTPHNLIPQSFVSIQGVLDGSYNGVGQIASIVDNSTFTFNQPGSNSSSSGGVVVSGWGFACLGIDDDALTFTNPLVLNLVPGVNDSSTLGGNPDFLGGLAFRHSPELYRIGGVNFVAGRRLRFQVNFPNGIGVNYQFRGVQLGFGVEPPN